jgi:predicted amidophosphoribosyltransferase
MGTERAETCSVCLSQLRRTEEEFTCPDCGIRWAAEHVIDLGAWSLPPGPWNVGGDA